ncbi:MAG: PaaI family thioesterase [Ottowia sp.]|uniref:PaaI family thioesterase n=1 Tax=Ottowia sp. TaxID=1898956 RepID=UPI0039E24DC6
MNSRETNPMPHVSLEIAQQVLRSQPFSQQLGADLTRFSSEGVELRIPITERIKQQNGFVHGGVVSYAADNSLTFAGGLALGAAVVTSEFKINYVRPALGQVLVARANVVHAGRTQAVCSCRIFCIDGEDEMLGAIAQGTIVALSWPR